MRTARTFLLIVFSASFVWADGMLDPDFGDGGRVTTSFGRTTMDWGMELAVQPDGRIVAAGTAYYSFGGTTTYMAIARYLPSGALDTTFDGDGLKLVDFGHPNGVGAFDLLLQPDGKLVLVGQQDITQSPVGYALARLNPDGSFDSSFGAEGKVVTPLANAVYAGAAALLQPDGRIVVLGAAGTPSTPTVALARYNSDGSLDGSFGTNGQVTVTQAPGLSGAALALQPDGRILVAGTWFYSTVDDFGLVRLLPSGALDASFDGDGIVRSDFGGLERGYAVEVLADGRILISGGVWQDSSTTIGLALVRYEPNGAVDTTFGKGGQASTHAGQWEVADAIVVQPDGKLLVAGWRGADFVVARFSANGAYDTSFGTGGFLTTDFGALDSAHALAIAGTDRVLALGTTYDSVADNQYFALARYIASTPVEVISFSVE